MRIRATLVSEHHPTRTETAMSAHAREHGTGAQWTHEAAIDDGIIRVRADRSTRWFITPDQPGTDVAEELHGFPSAAAGRVHDREGLLVPRCAGGLLGPALRGRDQGQS